MRILFTVASLDPSYGGPARSVPRLADALAERGHDVGLWAADGTAGETVFLKNHSEVARLGGGIAQAVAGFGRVDAYHDNGLWLPHNHTLALTAKRQGVPRVVSLRGMLDPWCRQSKRWKKDVAWRLYQRRDLESAAAVHATAELEARNIRECGVERPIAVIPNGIDLPDEEGLRARDSSPRQGVRQVLFVGRIYPVKGLPMLVRAWDRVRPEGWKLRIVGPDFEGHRAEVVRAIREHGLEDVMEFAGPMDGEAKRDVYRDSELFVLPTHSENFGMAVAEALAHGLPVLTTRGAPWSLLEKEGCGWWTEPTISGIETALREATATSPETLRKMGQKGRALVERRFRWDAVAEQVLDLYRWMGKGAPLPSFVHFG